MGLGLALASVIFPLSWLLCDVGQAFVSDGQSPTRPQGCCQNAMWSSREALLTRPGCASFRAQPLRAVSHDSSIFLPQAFFSL